MNLTKDYVRKQVDVFLESYKRGDLEGLDIFQNMITGNLEELNDIKFSSEVYAKLKNGMIIKSVVEKKS